jgi:hypothetical protein
MSINGGRSVLAGLLGSMLAVTPVLAESGHGSGGHASGGHAAGGAHGVAGGAHYAPGAHYAAGRGYAGGGAVAHSYGGGYRGSAYVGRGAYGYPGGYYRHGYSTGAYWGGGYWRGGFWPRAYYGLGFAWFLPILPAVYATYWYGGIPYYYANDVYYTWDPGYSGYVATDPPPVADSGGAGMATAPGAPAPEAGSGDGQYQGQQDPSQGQQAAGSAPQIFMYPKNGQSEQQQSTDKRECQQWAANQAGQGGENSSDYRRALVACVEGRGYSAN